MQIHTSSMSVMLAITKHGVCVLIAPCLVIFIMADMEEVCICISAHLSEILASAPWRMTCFLNFCIRACFQQVLI